MTVAGILRPKGVCGLQIDRKFELFFRSAQDGWSEAIPINAVYNADGFRKRLNQPTCYEPFNEVAYQRINPNAKPVPFALPYDRHPQI